MNHEITYKRPETLAEAIAILNEAPGVVRVLCGGVFNRIGLQDADLFLDLQDLVPSEAAKQGQFVLRPGNTITDLQQIMSQFVEFDIAATAEAGLNVRNTLSLYNYLKTADGRSPMLVALRAMNIVLRCQPSHQFVCLDEYLFTRNQEQRGFWSELVIEKPTSFVFESVSRTPLDKPIVSLAISSSNNQRLRVAIGGTVSLLDMTEIPNTGEGGRDWIIGVTNNLNDAWGSASYRQNVAIVLFDRLMQRLGHGRYGGAI